MHCPHDVTRVHRLATTHPSTLPRRRGGPVNAAGLSEDAAVNVHTLQHSAAAAMQTGGVPLLTVARMRGHSSVSITGDIYGHITDEGGW